MPDDKDPSKDGANLEGSANSGDAVKIAEELEGGMLVMEADLETTDEPKNPEKPEDQREVPKAVSVGRRMLGEILLEEGSINTDQLEMALAEQKRTRNLLGEVLVSLGFATEEMIARAISRQTGIAYIDLPHEPVAPNLLKLTAEEICRRHRLVPLGIEGSILKIAMANPFDVVALDTIRASTCLMPFPFIAQWSDIARVIEMSFSTIESFDETFEKLIGSAEARVGSDEKEAVARGPLVELVDQLILRAVGERATDLHIEPEEMIVSVRYRIDSVLQPGPMIPKPLQAAIAARIKIMAGLNISENRMPQDGRVIFNIKGRRIDLRVSTVRTNFGEKIVLRVLDPVTAIFSMERMGLFPDDHAKFERVIERPHGIILVTGPMRSGITTTVYAALSKLNTIDVSIMTIEDPIEYNLPLISQTNVDARTHTTFASNLRVLLRQDPDILFVGELPDAETAQMAMRAATTGHLVFSTLKTDSAVDAIMRLMEMKIEPLMISDAVVAVVSQRLVRVVCQKCQKRVKVPEDRRLELEYAALKGNIVWDGMVVEPEGCHDCRFRGFHGHRPLFEMLEMNREIEKFILRKCTRDELLEYVKRNGMRTIRESGLRRVLTHELSLGEFDRVVGNGPKVQ